MKLLMGIIGSLLVLSALIFVWAYVVRKHHVKKARNATLHKRFDGQPIDPMARAIAPRNPHASRANGDAAAERGFAPSMVARSPSLSTGPGKG